MMSFKNLFFLSLFLFCIACKKDSSSPSIYAGQWEGKYVRSPFELTFIITIEKQGNYEKVISIYGDSGYGFLCGQADRSGISTILGTYLNFVPRKGDCLEGYRFVGEFKDSQTFECKIIAYDGFEYQTIFKKK